MVFYQNIIVFGTRLGVTITHAQSSCDVTVDSLTFHGELQLYHHFVDVPESAVGVGNVGHHLGTLAPILTIRRPAVRPCVHGGSQEAA